MLIPIDKRFASSLDGTWRFKLEDAGAVEATAESQPIEVVDKPFEPFFEVQYQEDADWHDLACPGNWEMAGYSPATYWIPDSASAFYRRWIDVPADWAGRVVKVNFDGVQTGAEIWLNGVPVAVTEPSWGRSNYHESGWTAWQADLTPAVKFGEKNLLALRVTKSTKSSVLDSGDYYYLGGIYRPATLFSVPKTHIEDITVRTHLLPGNRAEVKVQVAVAGADADASKVEWHILDGMEFAPIAVKNGSAELHAVFDNPRLWSAEHPNLYPLHVTLSTPDGSVEQTQQRFGFREVAVKDGVLLVNGKAVKLTGICRHDVSAEEGSAVGEALWRKDLTLMKAANINSIRTSHYPYGAGFYDMCDEMGFYVIDELPYCWCPTDDGDLLPAFEQRARETLARDKNHACIIIWGIGNENRPGKNLQVIADLVKQLDPTRPRLVSEMPADKYGVEMDDQHYVPPESVQEAAGDNERRAKWPKIYTENPNVFDVRFGADYGCLDIWGEVIKREWDVIWKCPGIPGTFLWEWQDRAVADKCRTKLYQFDPATGINYVKVKGLVDSYRNPRPDYYHVKMAQSPTVVAPQVDLGSQPGSVVLDVTNRYSFTDLSEIAAKWTLYADGKELEAGVAKLPLAPETSGKVALALPEDALASADTLRIDFDHPGNSVRAGFEIPPEQSGYGWNVVSYQFELAKSKAKAAMVNKLPDGIAFPPILNLVWKSTVGDVDTWKRIYRYHAALDVTGASGMSTDSFKMEGDIKFASSYTLPAGEPKPVKSDAVPEALAVGTVVGHVKATYEKGVFKYRIEWTGPKVDLEELGWRFVMPKQYDHFSWDRKALWSYYPETHVGRPHGTALPDTMDVHLTHITRPDAFDFNSTKYDCNWASLTDAQDGGLRVEFAPDERHHVKGGFAQNGDYELVVNKQCSPPRDFSTNCVPDLYRELCAGDVIEGSFRVGSNR